MSREREEPTMYRLTRSRSPRGAARELGRSIAWLAVTGSSLGGVMAVLAGAAKALGR